HSRLSTIRWKLRDEITQLILDGADKEELEKTKSSYNDVLSALRELETRKRVDPIEVLPGEIIASILLGLLQDETERHEAKNPDILLSSMMVSRKWHQFIISDPLLWNYIPLLGQPDVSLVLRRHLYRSAGLP
ncbi:14072_t:CDS:1, partial [Acaulospora colombiana]